jgi:type II secretory pathway component PulM
MIDPVSASGVVIAALALAHQVLKSPSVPKSDKKKIAKEAERLVQIAQMSDIDKEVRKAKAAPAKKSAAKKAVIHRKVTPKKATVRRVAAQKTGTTRSRR